MEILFVVLNDLRYLDEIFEKFLELRVRGATIIDSQGMAAAIMKSDGLTSLMSGPFARSFEHADQTSKTLFTVIPEPEKVKEVVSAIQEIMARSRKDVVGFMFTMPVSGIYPLRPRKK